ncbi:cobyrinate a,c-diamide synthase [Veillonella intestinalis]|uniref:cobyrinate a,c-diamide synthase n=1 Tax=Veillonella intestinalis TaxID=2941341 RepID=UPI00203DE438|nr:cobyrinate a,c-diamide synthase [Veillonella intestinalis]
MKSYAIPRVVIAGTNSGVGKTTIVAGLLAAFYEQGKKVQAFKVGPDYIDPGFHKLASGRDCYNLDTWLVPPQKMKPFFADMAGDAELAIIEGVMGLYDGGREGVSSTAEIAKSLEAPVILVIDCKAMGESAAAIAKGFKEYDPTVNLAGVLLNRIGSDNHEHMIRVAMERLGIPVIGVIRRDERMHSPERHLGLTPVTEVNPQTALDTIREAIKQSVDLTALVKLAEAAPAVMVPEIVAKASAEPKVRIGVAYDEAFSFYYPASLQALADEGADLVYFSPLTDMELPSVDAVLFGGGFPEMFLTQLSENQSMLHSIREAAASGMPIYAECGGLMYLCEAVTDFEGNVRPMVGLVPAQCVMQAKLQKVGYVTATALQDTLLAPKGSSLRGHEFHFSTMEPVEPMTVDTFPWAFHFEGGRKGQTYNGGYSHGNILATYLHLNFAGNESAAAQFIAKARAYRAKEA